MFAHGATCDDSLSLVDLWLAQLQIGTAQDQLNSSGIGAGGENKIELHIARAAVIQHVDSRIHIAVTNPRIVGHIDPPLPRIVADEVVALARPRIFTYTARAKVGAGKSHGMRSHRQSVRGGLDAAASDEVTWLSGRLERLRRLSECAVRVHQLGGGVERRQENHT